MSEALHFLNIFHLKEMEQKKYVIYIDNHFTHTKKKILSQHALLPIWNANM